TLRRVIARPELNQVAERALPPALIGPNLGFEDTHPEPLEPFQVIGDRERERRRVSETGRLLPPTVANFTSSHLDGFACILPYVLRGRFQIQRKTVQLREISVHRTPPRGSGASLSECHQ